MPRQRMQPGEHGKITESRRRDVFIATTYVRDADGKRRRVERSSDKSAEDARRQLTRHLNVRRAPLRDQLIDDRTTLSQLFEVWLQAKAAEDGIAPQTQKKYRDTWRTHGSDRLGALRIAELPTSRADAHLRAVAVQAPTMSNYLRVILRGMYGLAVRYDAIDRNPIAETRRVKTERKPTRAVTPIEFEEVRLAVAAYAAGKPGRSGPKPGRLLPAYVEVAAATGLRPNEVLSLLWEEVDLLGAPPTATISGTLIDHGRVEGMPLHRQSWRKGHAPPHTVILPEFGVEALTSLVGQSGMVGPVFVNRDGGLVSLANLRRALRAALPDHLSWITPHSFRRTVATVVRDSMGAQVAQQQLSHAKLATTEAHYLQRQTTGPDARAVLQRFAAGESGG